MKKKQLFFLIILSSLHLFSQINVEWTKKFSAGAGTYNAASQLLVENQDAIYIFGNSINNGVNSLVLIKYDSQGNQKWNTVYLPNSQAAHSIQKAYIENNIIHLLTSVNSNSFFLIKFSSTGDFIEENQLISDVSFIRFLLKDNYFYTTETLYPWEDDGDYNMRDTKVSKYDLSGSMIWSHTYSFTQSTGFMFDNDGDILLFGRNDLTYYTNANGVEGDVKTDVFIRKIKTDGTELWMRSFSLEEDSIENLWGLALDEDNNGYFVYTNNNYITYTPPRIYKINSDGELLWSQVFTHPDYGNQTLYRSIQYHKSKIYLSGKSYIPDQANILTLSLDLDGTINWHSNLLTNSDYSGQYMFLRFDNNDNVYSFGYKYNSNAVGNIYLQANNPNGIVLDDLVFNSTGSGKETIRNAVTHLNAIYLLAQSNSQIMLLKISNEYASAVAEKNNTHIGVFPNPIVEKLNIAISKDISINNAKIKIFDMLGKTVFTEVLSKHNTHVFPSLKQGVYIIRLINNQRILYQNKVLVVDK